MLEHLQEREVALRRSPCDRAHACAEAGPTPGRICIKRKPSDLIAWVLDEAQHCQHVFDMRRIEELEATKLHKRNVAADKLDLQRAAVV